MVGSDPGAHVAGISRAVVCAGLVPLLLGLSGCSGITPYVNAHETNAVVRVRTDSGTFLSRTRADLDLYIVDAACGTKYLGSLRLDDASVDLGLSLGKKLRLAYVFSRSSFLRSGNSATVIEMMLTPREGYRYEFEVSYLKNTYGVTGLEFAPGRSQGRQIEYERLRDCVAR